MLVAVLCAAGQAAGAFNALLSSVVETTSESGVRVVLFMPGGVPQDWRLDGSGSNEIVVTLPNTGTGPGFHANSAAQPSLVQSLAVSNSGRNARVVIRLSANLHVETHLLPSALVLEIARPDVARPPIVASQTVGTTYTVLPLKYADVAEVANILTQGQLQPTDAFHPTSSAFSLPSSASGLASNLGIDGSTLQAAPIPGERLSDTIAIDRRLNALVLSGSPSEIASIRQLVTQIDVPVDSVMLDCKIVELTASSAHDLGLDFSQAPGGPVGQASLTTGNNPSSGISGSQFSAAFSAQLFATIAHGGGKVLATPRILSVDGAPAQILAGNAIPVIQSTIYPGSAAVTQVSTNYLTVGINLEILPRIRGDGNIEAHVYAEVSSVAAFVSTSQGNVPEVSLRRANTDAIVHDGSSLVIAGLLQDNEISNMSKIPIIGDLPLIGGLFRTNHDSTEHTNLYIVITPHIVKVIAPQ